MATFGDYELGARVGVGGMAEIYRARHLPSGQQVALKRVLPTVAEDEDLVTELLDEARIAGQLNHPGIARLLDAGQVAGLPYLAFEYVEGTSLQSLMAQAAARGERLPLGESIRIAAEVAAALSYAHHATGDDGQPLRLVHRDVTPSNILVARGAGGAPGVVKLIDFGIAKAEGRITRTTVGDIKGKLGYLSPEQAMGAAVDGRSDVFSLGICLWEALVGERLFQAPNELMLLTLIRSQDIVPPGARAPTVGEQIPAALDQIVLKALAKSPSERYADAADFEAALRAFAAASPGAERAAQGLGAPGSGTHQPRPGAPAHSAASGAGRPAPAPPRLGVSQENRMSDKGGSDLDVFDSLANKPAGPSSMPSGAAPSAPAPRPPTSPPAPRQKTLLGLPPPGPAPRVVSAPPPARPAPPPPSMPPAGRGSLPPRPPPAATAAPVDMDWDDEDEKTSIYDKGGTEDAARALLRSAPPPAAGTKAPASVAGLASSAAPPAPPSGAGPASEQLAQQQAQLAQQQAQLAQQAQFAQQQAQFAQQQAQYGQAQYAQVVQPPASGGRSALMAVAALLVVGLVAAAVLLFWPASTGKLVVTVSGPNNRAIDSLQVFVDGAKQCDTSPCILKDVEPGTHMVRVVASGYQGTADQAVKVPGGDEVVLKVELAVATGGTGVKVTAEGAGLKLFVDGQEVGPLPQEIKDMTPGEHTIRVAGSDRFEPYEQKLTITPDRIQEIGPLKLKVKKGLAHIKLGAGAQGARVVLVSGADRRPIPADKLDATRGLKIDIATDKPYRIEATKQGHENFRQEITFDDGEAEKTFEIVMYERGKQPERPVGGGVATPPVGGGTTPKAGGDTPPVATGNGTISINSIPVSNVILDGRPLGQTPRAGISVAAGNHTVVFVHAEHGRKVRSESVTVAVRFP